MADPGEPELSPERRDEIMNWVLRQVDRWGMYTPAILIAEGFRPMNYIFGQMAHFAAPYAHILGMGKLGDEVGFLLEDQANIDEFIRRVEEMGRADAERAAAERKARGRGWWPFRRRGPGGGGPGSTDGGTGGGATGPSSGSAGEAPAGPDSGPTAGP